MTTVQMLAAHWMVRSLGWTLLHFCWEGAAIAIALWCTLQLLSGRPAQQRYVAACAALGLIMVLPLATFSQIGWHEYRLAAEMQSAAVAADTSLVVQADSGEAASLFAKIAAQLDPYLPWVLALWLSGLLVSLVRLSVGLRLALRMKVIGVGPAPEPVQRLFDLCKQRLGIRRAVGLMNSALVQVPTVVGWLRPAVLLPVSCFTGLTDTQIEAILCHELAHIRRHDYLVSVVQSVVEAVLFYHPAVWWVSQQVRRERECCCDDLAVKIGGNALAYAKALSTLEARRSAYPEVVLGSNGGVLTMRIKRLLQCDEVSAGRQTAAAVVLVLLTIGAGAIAGTAQAEVRPASNAGVVAAPAIAQPPADALPTVRTSTIYKAATIVPSAKPAVVASAEVKPAEAARESETPQQSGPAKIAGGVMAGQIVSKVNPIYPADAKAACVQGTVVVRAIISKTGSVENLQVVSGPPELYTATLDAVRQWVYQPYLLNGEPMEVDTTINVNYNIAGSRCPAPQNDVPEAGGVGPKKIGGPVSAPLLVTSPSPEYTADAKAKKVSGSVVLKLVIDEQGIPTNVQVVRGIGYGLDEKAIDAVRQYRFKPAMEEGRPVAVATNIEVNFQVF